MITRYLKPISLSSTDWNNFVDSIVYAFTQVGFTEVTPTIEISGTRGIQFGNFKIDIYQDYYNGNVCAFKYYLKYGNENYKTFSKTSSINGASSSACNLCFFYSDDGKSVVINIAKDTEQLGKGKINVFYVIADNEEICGLKDTSSYTASEEYYSSNLYNVTLALKRTYQKEENVFFLDDGVPLRKVTDNSYVIDLPYLVTLGGAEAGYTYTMTNGDNYYCLIDNIAVKFDTTVFPQTGT